MAIKSRKMFSDNAERIYGELKEETGKIAALKEESDSEESTFRFVKIATVFALTVIFAAAVLLIFGNLPASGGGAEAPAVLLSEIMPFSSACPNADGLFFDYIELYNGSDTKADISGFRLDSTASKFGFVFGGDTVIPAYGYLTVSCDGKNSAHGEKAVYAPFSISASGGETITLASPSGAVVDSVSTVGLSKGEAMIRTKSAGWKTFSVGTPGFENSPAGRNAYIDSLREMRGLSITELMPKNISSVKTNDAERYDWIEITNTSGETIDLGGYHISDDPSELCGYVLPSVTIPPNGCVLLFASKLAKYEDGEIHTNFSLSCGGETLFLMNPQGRLDSVVEYPSLPDNYSFAYKDGGYAISAISSPGSIDTEQPENTYDGLKISEIMPENTAGITDGNGDFSDWIEIYNDSANDIDLSDCWLSADRTNVFGWKFPETIIKSGGRLLIFASGKSADKGSELHADFRLSSQSGIVTLTSPDGHEIDSVSYDSSRPDRSLVKTANGTESAAYQTPGFENSKDGYIAYQETLAAGSPLIISEAMTANDTVLRQPFGRYFDWIEIKNVGDKPVRLSDYYLSDDYKDSKMWQMPDTTIEPGSYRVFLCPGDEKLNSKKYALTNFSLDSETETVFIFDKDAKLCDRILLCDIPPNVSAGRMDGQNGLFLFSEPTPGAKNAGGVRTVSEAPYSTTAAGGYETPSLTIPLFSDGDIYYTTDGSRPDKGSKKYAGPITITESTVIRAIAYSKGQLKSGVTTLSFFLNEGNTLPILSLCADPSDIWSAKSGIYSQNNVFKPWEKDAHLEFFDSGGKGFSIDCGLRLYGGGTRKVSSKKSFQVRFRSVYGKSSLVYNMFEGDDTVEFKSLVLRAGQDARHTVFRDEIFSSIAVEEAPHLIAQHSRFCLLYINGKFFGIYCIKDRLGDDYYASHYNVSTGSVEVINGPVRKNTSLYALMSYVSHHDMRKKENYEYVKSKIDLESLVDWYIFEACSGNNDISGNVRYMRSSEGDGKWRVVLHDLDFALRWPINNFRWLYNNSNQHSKLLKGLIKNPEFKDMFLTRFGYLLNNVFTEDKLQARIDCFAAQLRGDIARERRKWHSNLTFDQALKIMENVLHKYDYKGRIIRSVCQTLKLNSAERIKYFGA